MEWRDISDLKSLSEEQKKIGYQLSHDRDMFANTLKNGLGDVIINDLNKEYVKPNILIRLRDSIKIFLINIKRIL